MPARWLNPAATISPEAIFAPLAPYGTVGLAVSGGPDSLALMLLAGEYSRMHRAPEFIVYTVDHGLRPEAAAEAAFVVREATRLGFPARSLRWEGRKPRTRIQEAARAARYRLIGEAMRSDGAAVLVTAHHLGDQAETVLMRLSHGSGLEGLRGMDHVSDVGGVTVVRPLLEIDPAALRSLVDATGIDPVADPSNCDDGYERVRWRAALPALALLGLDARRIDQFARRARDADHALDAMAREAFAAIAVTGKDGTLTIGRARLGALPRAVAIRVVQRALSEIGGAGKSHDLGALERFTDRLIQEPVTATLHRCIIRSDGITIAIRREPLTGARARLAGRTNP